MSSSIENNGLLPNWLDKCFIKKCLQTKFPGDQIEIHSFIANCATSKGDNFLSDIVRLRITYSNDKNTSGNADHISIIVKIASKDPNVLNNVSGMNIYDKESEMYEQILPKVKQLLEKFDEYEKIFAEIFYVCQTHNAIVFEDLAVGGFAIDKTKTGYNMELTKMILVKLAKFHAANAVLEDENPDMYRNFRKGLFNESSSWLTMFYEGQLDAIIDLLGSWPNYEYYVEKLTKLRTQLISKCITEFVASSHHFNTLLHGDMWTNNIMISYNPSDNRLQDVTLIDFQLSRWTSPALDLHHLFNTSLEGGLRLHNQAELVQFYYYALARLLKKLGYSKQIPTLLQFRVQFIEKSFYALTSAFVNQPFMIHNMEISADSESMFRDDDNARKYRRYILDDENVQTHIRNLLPIFDRDGLLD